MTDTKAPLEPPARKAARAYMAQGYAPIPLPTRSKNPDRKGWQNERHGIEDLPKIWKNGQGVGLLLGEPSGGLVDVDLDVPEAVRLGGRFLPPTRTSGREGIRDSHWWYHAPGSKTAKFADIGVEGEMLVELRSTGCQTVVEPSIHPGGDRYLWSRSGLEVAQVGADALLESCQRLATAVLIARHLPASGRHDFALALVGYLLRNGLAEETVLTILVAAWNVNDAPDEGLRDLRGIVRDTRARLERDEPVKGGRTLDGLVGGMPKALAKFLGWERADNGEGKADGKPGAARQRNQADRLIDYARETEAELFLDQFNMPHALVDGEAVPLNSRSYNWLRNLMWAKENASVGGDPLKTASGTLAAFAANEGRTRTLHTRAAYHDGAVYYQLDKGRVWRIDREGYRRDDAPPVVFRSISNLKELPDPEAGGTLDEVCSLINIKSDLGRRLWLAHTVLTLLEHIPRPIEEATGGAGAGKSTFSRYKKRLLDPTAPESIRLDRRDFLQKADHTFIVLLDNLNSLPEWAEDTLCRLVTGEGDSKRVLYSDDDDYIFEMKRAILLNGINPPADRSDVRDRTLPVELRRIPDNRRRSEEDLWDEFREKHPRMLGAILDTLSRALKAKESVTLSRRPRLADWGEYAAAVYECEGWSEGDKRGAELFMEDWDKVVLMQDRGTVEGSLLAQAIVTLMKTREEYRGFASDLYQDLRPIAEDDLHVNTERDKDWPTNAVWLARKLREIEPTLDSSFGIEVRRKNHKRGSYLIISKRGDGGDDPGSGGGGGKGPFTSTLTSTLPPPHNPDTYGEGGGKASSGAKTGYSYPPHPRTDEREGDIEGNMKGGGVNSSRFTTTTTTTTTPGVGRDGNENGAREGSVPPHPSSPLDDFFSDPPDWLATQLDKCREHEKFVGPTCSSVAYEVFGTAARWAEAVPVLRRHLAEGVRS
ncbi:MAG: bifunctional DNA primase/polymerase [Actinomycetota bacterium]|nr:bifunctional DNA primase/polymerase [Actinomycetota bacterium]